MSLMNEISERIRRPFLAGMAILLIAGLGSYFALQRYRLTSLQVAYSDQVMVQLNDLLANLDQAEAAERAYLTSSGNLLVRRGIRRWPRRSSKIWRGWSRPREWRTRYRMISLHWPRRSTRRLNFFDQLSSVRLSQGEAAATAMYTAGVSLTVSSV